MLHADLLDKIFFLTSVGFFFFCNTLIRMRSLFFLFIFFNDIGVFCRIPSSLAPSPVITENCRFFYSSLVQSLSCVWLFGIPWTAACQASLSITNSCPLCQWCHPAILCHPFLLSPSIFPSIRAFSRESAGGQGTGVSASASVLLLNIQDWVPLRLTGWISLKSKGLSRVFSNTTVQKHKYFGAQFSL